MLPNKAEGAQVSKTRNINLKKLLTFKDLNQKNKPENHHQRYVSQKPKQNTITLLKRHLKKRNEKP